MPEWAFFNERNRQTVTTKIINVAEMEAQRLEDVTIGLTNA